MQCRRQGKEERISNVADKKARVNTPLPRNATLEP